MASEDGDLLNCTVIQLDNAAELRSDRIGSEAVDEGEDGDESLLRLPEMTDTSMDTVGQPLRDVMDRLNGALDKEEAWEEVGDKNTEGFDHGTEPPEQQPFREESGGEPPDRARGERTLSHVATSPDSLQASPSPTDVCCFAPLSPDSTSSGGGHYDSTEHGQSQTLSGGLEGEGETKTAAAGQEPDLKNKKEDIEAGQQTENHALAKESNDMREQKLSPSESSHPAEFK